MEFGEKVLDILWHVRHPVESGRTAKYRFSIEQNYPAGMKSQKISSRKLYQEIKGSQRLTQTDPNVSSRVGR